ncbi:MAG: MotA/TolQ/ExbB proton channel family protein [Lentisphaerae bacterium]|jgi:biopolymer transport protein ExbB/TolQ|nr:MotA/TolQ/ExbB proton channel family protein [Lentisphaerota bacterium]
MLIANSLVEGFFKSNLMGQAIVAIQVLGSIVMIAVIIGKWRELAFLTSITRRFLRDFSTFGDVLGYYVKRRPAITDGIETIYKETCERLIRMITPELRVVGGVQPSPQPSALSPHEIELVRSTCEHALQEEELKIEKGMGIIQTVVSMAPMLGLLGTVWGVLDAFADMGAAQSANLATIAPSISSALVTTVVGLIVAIIGVVFFNHMNGIIRALSSDMEGFADELTGRIANEYQGRGA